MLPTWKVSDFIFRDCARIHRIQTRNGFDSLREALARDYGMKMPQEINDDLTRKHLELKGRGE